jgi:hypothetical protein
MPKFDCQYRTDSPNGKAAVELLEKLSLGGSLTSPLIPSLSAPAEWVLEEKEPGRWKLQGSFCTIPLYSLTIAIEGDRIGMKVEELP